MTWQAFITISSIIVKVPSLTVRRPMSMRAGSIFDR